MLPTPPLKVKMLSAADLKGGAGIAAYRLQLGLERIGVESELFVRDRRSRHPTVIGPHSWLCRLFGRLHPYLDPVPKLAYFKRHRGAWSCGFLPNPCLPLKQLRSADVVHLHWVGGGLLPVRALRQLHRPIVWTLHDSWPFTGGCHIPYDCQGFQLRCGNCPQLASLRERDLSRLIWLHKFRHWQDLRMTIVAPSRWLASLAATSTLLMDCPIEVIPNGLDLEVFTPLDKAQARQQLGLPPNARMILFSAVAGVANWNKGGDLLREALHILAGRGGTGKYLLLLTGAGTPPAADYFPVPVINLGVIDDPQRQSLIYSAADITAVPSRSESLGYVAMESMACGTPCVGFRVGGLPDLVDHLDTGYLAVAASVNDLAAGISWLFEDGPRRQAMAVRAHAKIEANYGHAAVARRYLELYQRALEQWHA